MKYILESEVFSQTLCMCLKFTLLLQQGGRSKGAAAKGARAAALTFAKRVLTRVKKFDEGHSCIVDPALRESLFHLVPQVAESAPGATGADCGGGALTAVSDSTISNSNPPLKLRGKLFISAYTIIVQDLD